MKARIRRASQDRYVWRVPTSDVMKRYRINHYAAQEAQNRAKKKVKSNKVVRLQLRDKLIESIARAEDNYPGIMRRCSNSQKWKSIGDDYDISRERVRQFGEKLRDCARVLRVPLADVVKRAERGRLPSTGWEKFMAESQAA